MPSLRNPAIEEKVRRPVKLLAAFSRRHLGLWKAVDQLRTNRDQIRQKGYYWPEWCYLPLGAAGSLLGPAEPNYEADFKIEASKIATLASWRLAKDIYVFDETVFEELWATPIEGNLPTEILYRLPAFCAYVPFPAPRLIDDGKTRGECYGFFVHLNHSKGPVLMVAWDFGAVEYIDAEHILLVPFPLELHEGHDLLQCLTVMHAKAQQQRAQLASEELALCVQPSAVKSVLEPLLSLTIYLCSTSAEIRAQDPYRGLRREAYSKKTKQGVRTFVPDQPRLWEVAFRIGATLRAAAASATRRGDGEGTHASPRPHIRRAHWHSFWTGPKAAVGKPAVPARELVVKWIPPIPVAMGPDGEIVPTVHRVTR